jgi:hypothetical protein
MQIGAPERTIVVEPLEPPVKPPDDDPEPESIQLPKPEKVPVAQ